jgi:hypothetical protein
MFEPVLSEELFLSDFLRRPVNVSSRQTLHSLPDFVVFGQLTQKLVRKLVLKKVFKEKM